MVNISLNSGRGVCVAGMGAQGTGHNCTIVHGCLLQVAGPGLCKDVCVCGQLQGAGYICVWLWLRLAVLPAGDTVLHSATSYRMPAFP
jgi:hypothetical protein